MAKRIDGKVISKQIKDELKEEVAQLKAKGIEGSLAVIQVGNDPASSVYVNNKKKACEYIGIGSISYELPEETTEAELLDIIEDLNKREDVCGILVQLPVPKHIDEVRSSGNFTKERCGWFSSAECRCNDYRRTGLFILYTGRNYPVVKTFKY